MNVAKRELSRSLYQPGIHYINPEPCCACVIPGGLRTGARIQIHATLSADRKLDVRVQRGSGDEPLGAYLQVTVLVKRRREGHGSDDEGEKVMMVNTTTTMRHDDDGDGGKGRQDHEQQEVEILSRLQGAATFILVLSCSMRHFQIEMNGSPMTNLEHQNQLDFSKVTHCVVDGGLHACLHSLQIMPNSEHLPQEMRISVPASELISQGYIYRLKGQLNDDPQSFEINLQSGPGKMEDVLFHLGASLDHKWSVAHKMRVDEHWQNVEEFDLGASMDEGTKVDVAILANGTGYTWTMSPGELSGVLQSNVFLSPAAKSLVLTGDLVIDNILIHFPLIRYMSQDGLLQTLKDFNTHVFGQHEPSKTDLPSTFENSAALLISVKIFKKTERFDAILETDEDATKVEKLQIEIESDENGDKMMNVRKWASEGGWCKVFKQEPVHILGKEDEQFDLLLVNKVKDIIVVINGVYYRTIRSTPRQLSRFSVPNRSQISRILFITSSFQT